MQTHLIIKFVETGIMIRSCPDRLEFKNECYSTANQSISKKQRYLYYLYGKNKD
jgi:hypothetical protein